MKLRTDITRLTALLVSNRDSHTNFEIEKVSCSIGEAMDALEAELTNAKLIQAVLIFLMWEHAYPEYQANMETVEEIWKKGFTLEPDFKTEITKAGDIKELVTMLVKKGDKWAGPPNHPGYTEKVNIATKAEDRDQWEARKDVGD